MYPVLPVMKHYAWGSYHRLQSLMASSSLLHDEGIQAQDGRPLAELWYGAHPRWPSSIATADHDMQELSARIAQEPLDMLGADCNERFGPSLPYLLKILAVRSPLSLQVHPMAHQARAGFNAEELSGIAHDDTKRSFPDAQEKNEMVVALDDFYASVGFRPITSIIHDLSIIDHEVAQEMLSALQHVQDDEGREIDKSVSGQGKIQEGKDSRGSFGIVSRSNHPNRLRNALRIAITASQQEGVADSLQCALEESDPCNNAIRHAFIAAQQFPSDPSAFALVLMNPVSLCAGEALYIPAGTLHAYIHGFGAEIMTNSDTVLRAGLTVKHKDIAGHWMVFEYGRMVSSTHMSFQVASRQVCRAVYSFLDWMNLSWWLDRFIQWALESRFSRNAMSNKMPESDVWLKHSSVLVLVWLCALKAHYAV